ncbi:MAG: right-handed parallel beta-helix repeat-containing protein [Pseudomonadota bacterium]
MRSFKPISNLFILFLIFIFVNFSFIFISCTSNITEDDTTEDDSYTDDGSSGEAEEEETEAEEEETETEEEQEEETAPSTYTYYLDDDSDGYGDANTSTTAESAPSGYVANATDCDDTDANINPGASETCNEIDDDCDGTVDDGLTSYTYYKDLDEDTYGDWETTIAICHDSAPTGYVEIMGDCDDSDDSLPNIIVRQDGLGDFTEISTAVADAGTVNGDCIVVYPSTALDPYEGEFEVSDNISIISTNGASQTSIYGTGTSSNIFLNGGQSFKIIGFTIENGGGSTGGGIYLVAVSTSFTVANNIIKNNSSTNGAGITVNNSGSGTISNNTIFGNDASNSAGGVYITACSTTVTIENNRIYNNTANISDGRAGGIQINNSVVDISDNTIYSNTAEDGGGIYVSGTSRANIENNSIYNHDVGAAGKGGGIYIEGTSVTYINIASNDIYNNSGYKGGAIELANAGNITACTINSNNFYDNSVTNYGGAIHFEDAPIEHKIYNNIFTRNNAQSGSAIHFTTAMGVNVLNNIFYANGNDGSLTNSGTIYLQTENETTVNKAYIANNTLMYNSTNIQGTISRGSTFDISLYAGNNIITNNDCGVRIYNREETYFISNLLYDNNDDNYCSSNISGFATMSGNIEDEDPLLDFTLVSSTDDDADGIPNELEDESDENFDEIKINTEFTISASSPCIDAGTNNIDSSDSDPDDIDNDTFAEDWNHDGTNDTSVVLIDCGVHDGIYGVSW